jgi:CcmD family protein
MTEAITEGTTLWVVGVNLVIWTGLFLYLLRLSRRLDRLEKDL